MYPNQDVDPRFRSPRGILKDRMALYSCDNHSCPGRRGEEKHTFTVTRAYLGDCRDPEVWMDGVDGERVECELCGSRLTSFVELQGLAAHEAA